MYNFSVFGGLIIKLGFILLGKMSLFGIEIIGVVLFLFEEVFKFV